MAVANMGAAIGQPSQWTYLSVDGQEYNLGSSNSTLQFYLGELSAGDTGLPAFPFHWQPRRVRLVGEIDGVPVTVHVACSPTASVYLNGPGRTVTVAGIDFYVAACLGESQAG